MIIYFSLEIELFCLGIILTRCRLLARGLKLILIFLIFDLRSNPANDDKLIIDLLVFCKSYSLFRLDRSIVFGYDRRLLLVVL